MFALKTKGKFEFSKPFKTEVELDRHIDTLFHNWKGRQSRGSTLTLEDFMDGQEKVFVTIKRL